MLCLGQRQADLAIGGQQDAVAMLFEQQPEQRSDAVIIVDYQNIWSVQTHNMFPSTGSFLYVCSCAFGSTRCGDVGVHVVVM